MPYYSTTNITINSTMRLLFANTHVTFDILWFYWFYWFPVCCDWNLFCFAVNGFFCVNFCFLFYYYYWLWLHLPLSLLIVKTFSAPPVSYAPWTITKAQTSSNVSPCIASAVIAAFSPPCWLDAMHRHKQIQTKILLFWSLTQECALTQLQSIKCIHFESTNTQN